MTEMNLKRGAGNLPVIIAIAVVGGVFGYLYTSEIIPQEVSTALILALVFGLLAKTSCSTSEEETPLPTMDTGTGATADEIAEAVSSAVEQALGNSREQLAGLDAGLQKTANTMQSSLDASATKLSQALGDHSSALSSGGESWKSQIQEAFSGHGSVLESGASAIAAAGSGWQGEMSKLLESHASKIEASSAAMSTNFEKVSEDLAKSLSASTSELAQKLDEVSKIGNNIDSILQATQASNEAVQSLTNADEFKETLNSFRTAIGESQAMLKKASRPKSFRLAETFEE